MKFTADCGPCLMRRVLFQSRLAGTGLEFDAVKAAAEVLAERMDPDTDSVRIATEVHCMAYAAARCDDPYREMKLRADEAAGPVAERLEDLVAASDDPFRTAVMGAVAGNILDFGVGGAMDSPDGFADAYRELVAQGLGVDDVEALRGLVASNPGVVYLFDNCGESRLDMVFIRLLRRMGKRVVAVARGAPILNDVSLEDAHRIGVEKDVDLLLTTGKFQIGIDWDDVPPELSGEIRSCGLIIAKGMANFEATSGRSLPVPIAHILRTKCGPVAAAIGAPQNVNVVRVITPQKRMHS